MIEQIERLIFESRRVGHVPCIVVVRLDKEGDICFLDPKRNL